MRLPLARRTLFSGSQTSNNYLERAWPELSRSLDRYSLPDQHRGCLFNLLPGDQDGADMLSNRARNIRA